jgi:hypothetical protein
MNIYSRDEERAIRIQRLVHDWNKSGIITGEQRDRMLPDVKVDLRRTNMFLRGTLFVFAFMIVQSAAGLVAVTLDLDNRYVVGVIALIAGVASYAAAQRLVTQYRLYRFGIEEAAAMAAAVFLVAAGWILFNLQYNYATLYAFAVAALLSFALFRRFGFVYAGVGAIAFATFFIFDIDQSDTFRRLFSFVFLLTVFFYSRERRQDHDWDFPADTYAVFEALSWAALYLIANLKLSSWVSTPDDVKQFYWLTYVLIWILPAAGLWFAIRDRHRLMLDVNIALAIITLMSNKPYLGATQKPWDPILFGIMLVGVSLGLRQWLASGANGTRSGFVAHRLLESEKAALAMAGNATVLAPGAPPPSAHEPPPPSFGGGRSGGAGASGSF